MKKTLISCGVAAILAMSAGAAMAGTLDPGLYTITFTGGSMSEQDPVSITGTGGSRDIDFGGTTIHTTVSGSSFSGSANASGIAVTLNGTSSGSGGSGTFHLSRSGRVANGTFSLAQRPMNIAHLPKQSNAANSMSTWDSICAWFSGFLTVGGSAGAPTAPTPSGSGSSSHGLATYTPK